MVRLPDDYLEECLDLAVVKKCYRDYHIILTSHFKIIKVCILL